MDFATVIGAVLGYALILIALVMGGGIIQYVDIPSVLIVIGGCFGILLMCFPLGTFMNFMTVTLKTVKSPKQNASSLIEMLVEFAVKARRDGILSLESAGDSVTDEFLKKGIRLAVDGTEPEVIRDILETELNYMGERHKTGAGILGALVEYGPAMGMIGTLIGLVAMLQTMDDPSSIGPAMATAILTTFYGAMIANMFAGPLKFKLEGRSAQETLIREIMIAGIMAIQAGDNPRIVEQKLNAYLAPKERKSQFN
ncbi:motility protein A [Seleniivibrio woodruffii]|uniref:motility protein A n=1 Tax=Seleniivibrio woodruffii TaxID=1078050 RepID=UPI0026EC9D71|nr:MotA/TolQ/ExbB proton channel family protein [Seleniivibrio woodruffii]